MFFNGILKVPQKFHDCFWQVVYKEFSVVCLTNAMVMTSYFLFKVKKNSVVNFDMLYFTHTNTYEVIYLEYWFQFEYGYGMVFREFLMTNRCQIILCIVYY